MASAPVHKKLAYSVEEAADLLSISRAQVYRLIDSLELGSILIGRSRRVTAGQLDDFVARSVSERGGITPIQTPGRR